MGSAGKKTATKSGTLTLVVLSALVLIAGRPARAQVETVLYTFTGGSDGAHPFSGLTSDGAGNLYGTTPYSGLVGGYDGFGTVYKLSPNGNGGWNQTTIYSFTGGADGGTPYAASVILDSAGNLYGTATNGGANGKGVVFKLSPDGEGWRQTVLYSFSDGADGGNPETSLIMDQAGTLYGTTHGIRAGEDGTVFTLTPVSSGWIERVIHSVKTTSYAGLTMDADGNIFGIANESVIKLSPDGHGGWNPTVVYAFAGDQDGSYVQGTPILDKAGNIYGTTTYGGKYGRGTVYKLSHRKKGWKKEILHSFRGDTEDGGNPFAGITFDAAGNIYGTTPVGGKYGKGTVFKLVVPVGSRKYKERILWNFNGRNGDNPDGILLLGSSGNLYGTTYFGGPNDAGVVFELRLRSSARTIPSDK